MLQVFHLNVVKINLDVAYVAMAIHTCFKCFICFRRQLFHLDISKVDLGGAHVVMACCCCVGYRGGAVCFKSKLLLL